MAQQKDKEGNPVRFIRKGGRVIPIRAKPGDLEKEYGKGYNKELKNLHSAKETLRKTGKKQSSGRRMMDAGGNIAAGGVLAAGVGLLGKSRGLSRGGLALTIGGAALAALGQTRVSSVKGERGQALYDHNKSMGRLNRMRKDAKRNIKNRHFVANQNKKYDPKGQKRK